MPWKKSEPMDQRREFALKALETLNFRVLCQEYGISTKTGYKWRERFLRQGLEGMEEESRRPRSSPKQLSESQICEMVKLKLVHRHSLGLCPRRTAAKSSSFPRPLPHPARLGSNPLAPR